MGRAGAPWALAALTVAGCVDLTPPAGLSREDARGAGDEDAGDGPAPARDVAPESGRSDRPVTPVGPEARDAAAPDRGTDPTAERAPDAPPEDAATPPEDAVAPPEDVAPPPRDLMPEAPDAPLAAQGTPCQSPAQCASGVCASGVCCNAECQGPCRACNLAGTIGSCMPMPATTMCAPGSCSGTTETAARTCDGMGSCRPATARDCAPYRCAGAVCASSCAVPGDCQPTHYCGGALCRPKKAAGGDCADPVECASGFCASGVCCNQACADACLACNLGGAVGTCSPRPPGALVGHWRLDERTGTTARDSSCSGLDGLLMEYATPDWRPSPRGGALAFDGISQWVKVPDAQDRLDAIAATKAFTLAAWVLRTGRGPNWSNVISRQGLDTGGEHYSLTFDDGAGGRLAVIINSHSAGASCSSQTITPLDRWVHVAATYDGTTARVYSDGAQVCSFAYGNPIATETKPLIIGGNANNAADDAQELFQGLIDEALVYSRALSAAEIMALAAGGAPPAQ